MDECMKHYLDRLIKQFDLNVDVYHDFDMNHHRRPKMLMQTAGERLEQ